MPAKEYNEVKMRGILPSEGMNPIPVTESAPLTSIQVEPKPNATPIPVGKIPDGGTQIAKYAFAVNNTVNIHTVTAGKILYLNALILSCYTAQPASFVGYMTVHDELDNLQYYFFLFRCPGDGCVNGSLGFPFPLEIPEGWRINVLSNAALSYSTGFIHGYEL